MCPPIPSFCFSPSPADFFGGVSHLPRVFALFANAFCRLSLEHDLQVNEIATAFQFTPDEVAAYYFRVNQDTGRTRRRFEKARKLLDDMSDVE